MLRVLHFGISSNLGGIETYSIKIAKNFNRNKYHFDFLYLGENKPCFYNELKNLGCGFFKVTSRRKSYTKYLKELDNLFRNEQFDIVHLHLNSLKNISPVLYALKYGHKVIVHSRNGGGSTKLLDKIVNKVNFYRLPKKRIKMLAVSDVAAEWMFGINADCIVINNGINTDEFKFNLPSRTRLRKELNIEDEQVIVHTGSFKSQKNHKFLIEVFNEIYKKNPNVKLLLVGEGPLKPMIENMVKKYNLNENVIFLGLRKDIPDILSAGDYFLFPSLYEGFPNSLIEAEVSGLRCVVSDTITSEVISPNLCKRVSLSESAKVWADLFFENTRIDREEGYKFVIENRLDIPSEIEKLEEIYESILPKKGTVS